MYLLFFDLLGVKHLWKEDGVRGVKAASEEIKSLITSISKKETEVNIIKGGIETDSVALVFNTAIEAVKFAVSLYREAFDYAKEEEFRLWFRGVIKVHDGGILREESKGTEKLENVDIVKYSGELLDAIAVEKSGIKGMRLLIERSIVNLALKEPFRLKIGEKDLDIFKKLKNSPYPNKRLEPYEDILWMLTHDDEKWRRREIKMATRLRFAAHYEEEFLHAAATQLIFHECKAIMTAIRTRM